MTQILALQQLATENRTNDELPGSALSTVCTNVR